MRTTSEAPVAEPQSVNRSAGRRSAGASPAAATRDSERSRSMASGTRFGELEVIERSTCRSQPGEVAGRRRAVGVREVDAAGARSAACGSQTRARSRSAASVDAPGRLRRCAYMPQRDLLLPWLLGDRQRRARAAEPGRLAARPRRGARTALFERFGLAGFERAEPGGAVRRHAPAGRVPAHAAGRQAGAAARRAVRLARRASPAPRCRSGWQRRWRPSRGP